MALMQITLFLKKMEFSKTIIFKEFFFVKENEKYFEIFIFYSSKWNLQN
jgi:hypothetical protein